MLEMMNSTMTQIFAAYSGYVGSGMYMLLFFVSLLFIYIRERRNGKKTLLFFFPLVVLAVIFNPLIAYRIISIIEVSVYWRVFWILPVTVVIAYAATTTILSISRKFRKVVVVIALIAILMMGGKFIYTAENYSTPSNWYKLPAQTIEVCNILEKDCDGEIRVVVPGDLLSSVRQYDANIQMAYGRNGGLNNYDSTYGDRLALYSLMQESELNVELISEYMSGLECNYLVLHKTALLLDSLENYGYQYLVSTESYNIYRFN